MRDDLAGTGSHEREKGDRLCLHTSWDDEKLKTRAAEFKMFLIQTVVDERDVTLAMYSRKLWTRGTSPEGTKQKKKGELSEERLHSAVFSAGERRRNTKNSELSTRNAAEFPGLVRESRAPEAGYAGGAGNLAETGARRSNKFSGAGAERDGRNWGQKRAPLRQHRWLISGPGDHKSSSDLHIPSLLRTGPEIPWRNLIKPQTNSSPEKNTTA